MKMGYKRLWVLLIWVLVMVSLRKDVKIATDNMGRANKGEEVALPICCVSAIT